MGEARYVCVRASAPPPRGKNREGVMTTIADQSETTAFLRAALTDAAGAPRLVQTHASLVFLGADRCFKLKRAVRYPFLDFSTPQRRLDLCRREVELNRRAAPALYLGARAVTRESDGALAFDGAGDLVDAVVEMRRFVDADLLDQRALAGDLPQQMMTRLARRLAAFHAAAPADRTRGGAEAMTRIIALDEAALRQTGLLASDQADTLFASLRAALERHAPLLDARRKAGKVRRCHGDLTLRNICVFQGEATPFDCLEFDEDLATIDVLHDLAFLLMDLWRRERRDTANLVLNRYLDAADETDGLALLPFFMAMRATVRAHVAAAQAKETNGAEAEALRAEALAYIETAAACLAPRPPALIAIGGFSGAGKSTLAALIAPDIGPPPGARVLSSDRIRKATFGVEAETRLPPDAYRPEVSRVVYGAQRAAAAATLANGVAVVADAVFTRVDSREAIERIAREAGVAFRGIWLDAPLDALAARVDARRGDPSDATVEVLRAQTREPIGVMSWTQVDASSEREATRRALLRELAREATRLDQDAV